MLLPSIRILDMLRDTVGEYVGADVGINVGADVGINVGADVGINVGAGIDAGAIECQDVYCYDLNQSISLCFICHTGVMQICLLH